MACPPHRRPRRPAQPIAPLFADTRGLATLPAGRYPSGLTLARIAVETIDGAAEVAAVLTDSDGRAHPLALRIERDTKTRPSGIAVARPTSCRAPAGCWPMDDERLNDRARERRRGLLAAGDPKGRVRDAWTAKEALREIYRIGDPDLALEWFTGLAATLNDRAYCPEIRRLGRMLSRWALQIPAWYRSRASNTSVKAINGLA